jgi:CTP-dependent riboflavin kinase
VCEQSDLSGVVQPGRGLATGLMADRVVMQTLEELAGFRLAPGTLNLRLPAPLERGAIWRYMSAEEITQDWETQTGQAGYYIARVTVAGRYRGLAFQALEPSDPGYPPDQIELFCEVRLRAALSLDDGDLIAVRLDDG